MGGSRRRPESREPDADLACTGALYRSSVRQGPTTSSLLPQPACRLPANDSIATLLPWLASSSRADATLLFAGSRATTPQASCESSRRLSYPVFSRRQSPERTPWIAETKTSEAWQQPQLIFTSRISPLPPNSTVPLPQRQVHRPLPRHHTDTILIP